MYPGLDVEKMSDEELVNKINSLYQRLIQASSYSLQSEIVDQLHYLIELLQFEQQERMYKRAWEKDQKKVPDIIETDPGDEPKTASTPKKKDSKRPSGIGLMSRSKRPTR